jgi:hypothetical protein
MIDSGVWSSAVHYRSLRRADDNSLNQLGHAMGFEVMPRVGQLRTDDARAVLGAGFATATHVDVLVLGNAGEIPLTARVGRRRAVRGEVIAAVG